MSGENKEIPYLYSPDGKGGAGEGRGAPEAPLKDDEGGAEDGEKK